MLKPNGLLFFRVNSVNDTNSRAGQGKEIETHLYETNDGRYKSFFDKNVKIVSNKIDFKNKSNSTYVHRLKQK